MHKGLENEKAREVVNDNRMCIDNGVYNDSRTSLDNICRDNFQENPETKVGNIK